MSPVPRPREPDEEPEDREVAMQVRCLHCLREQYAPAVMPISFGDAGCVWCGHVSKKMTEAEYRNALADARLNRTASDGPPGGSPLA